MPAKSHAGASAARFLAAPSTETNEMATLALSVASLLTSKSRVAPTWGPAICGPARPRAFSSGGTTLGTATELPLHELFAVNGRSKVIM
jgi:hypothetical protein